MDLDITDAQGLTPLHLAVSVAPLKVVSQLLEAGQDINAQAGRARRSELGQSQQWLAQEQGLQSSTVFFTLCLKGVQPPQAGYSAERRRLGGVLSNQHLPMPHNIGICRGL